MSSRPVWSRTSEVPSSVLLHLWAKFKNQTESVIVAYRGLGNWDDERVWHVEFPQEHASTECLAYLSLLGFLDRQLGFGLPLH